MVLVDTTIILEAGLEKERTALQPYIGVVLIIVVLV